VWSTKSPAKIACGNFKRTLHVNLQSSFVVSRIKSIKKMPWEEVKKCKDSGRFLGDGRNLGSALMSWKASVNQSIGRCFRVFFGRTAKVEAEFKKRMREWGLDEGLHAAFWNSHLQYVRNFYMCGVMDPQPNNIPILLPNDPVRQVMTQEFDALVKEKGILKIRDTLKDEHPELDDYSRPLKFAPATKRYEVRSSFAELCILRRQVDPFERFYQWDRLESISQLRDLYTFDAFVILLLSS
jgi:hypothetical protein